MNPFRRDATAIALDGNQLLVRPAAPGEGTPVCGGSGLRFRWLWFGLDAPGLCEDEVGKLFEDPSGFARFRGVWAFFAADPAGRRTLCAADRLGIQAVYYRPELAFVSTNPMWLLTATGHDGSCLREGLEDHLGFGYAIHPERQYYRGVVRLAPASYRITSDGSSRTVRYWDGESTPGGEPDLDSLVAILREAGRAPGREPWFGLTAGKDSLCLASVAETGRGITFGDPGCADQVQGRELAALLGWEHRTATLCEPADFERWCHWIAEHSAGLTTGSYVDMLDAIERTIPVGGAFVMGEAGECVRDFFRSTGGSPIDYLAANYVTPGDFVRRTLVEELRPGAEYPGPLLERAGLLAGDPARAALSFYRNCRMPGNFAQRNAVLAPLRAKLAPFADARFIDDSYGLGAAWFGGSRLHRELIARVRPGLLPLFDSPRTQGTSPQEWVARTGGPLRETILRILEDAAPSLPEGWDREGVLELARQQPLPPRAVYYLLRVVPLSIAAKLVKTGQGSGVPEVSLV